MDSIYPLFGWNEPVPNEFKEIFYQSEINIFRKPSSTLDESLIVDEDYEIIGKNQSETSVCPICYQIVPLGNTQLYSNQLSRYYDVHTHCALTCKQKTAKLALLSSSLQSATFMERLPLEHDLRDLGIKVYVELKVYHPIAQQPLLHLTNSTTLKHKNTLIMDYANHREYFGKKQNILIPLSEGRISVEIHIIDGTLTQEQGSRQFEFLYDTTKNDSEYVCMGSQGVYVSCNCESGELCLKMLMITLPDLNLNRKSPKSPPSSDSFLFSPSIKPYTAQVYTPQVGPVLVQPRARFPSFQLEEQTQPDEWTEDLQSFEQIRGNIVNFVKTQHGSRLIQKYFTTCTQSELDQLLQEIGPHIGELMVDPYANYMFGSLSQSCAPNQRLFIFTKVSSMNIQIQNYLVDIACDKKGTHAIQSLVSLISSKQEEEMVENSIRNHIITLTLDSQGTHLIKKIIARFSDERLNTVFVKLMERFLLIVNHQFGLCVLKDLITKFKGNSEKCSLILCKMRDQLDEIVQDPFGNYAIQHVIDVYGDNKCTPIIDRILQKLVQLSIHKYSSNVVEKCILETSQKTQRRFIKQLSQDGVCLELMKNKFGTFVLQKALQEAEKLGEGEGLQAALSRNLPAIYASNIRQKWMEYLSKK